MSAHLRPVHANIGANEGSICGPSGGNWGPDAIPKSTFRYPVTVTESVEGDVFQIIHVSSSVVNSSSAVSSRVQ